MYIGGYSHRNKHMAILTDDEQKIAEQLIGIVKPLKPLMSSETTPNMSMILTLKEMILNEDRTATKEAKEAFTQDLERTWRDPDLQKYLQKATVLEPRFKSLPSLDEHSLVRLL